MPLCRNKSCKAKLPKGTLPQVCDDACRDAAISQALEKKRAADKRAAARAKNLAEREAKESRKEAKRKRSDYWAGQLPRQKKLTQDAFNEMIRWLDRGKITRCPTCDEPLAEGEGEAGHVLTVAAYPQLRYDARGCFLQCRPCNGSGTIRHRVRKTQEVVSALYREWIKRTFGQAYYDWLYGFHPSKDYTCEALIVMRKEFNAETRRLKQGLGPSKDWRALPVSKPMESAA